MSGSLIYFAQIALPLIFLLQFVYVCMLIYLLAVNSLYHNFLIYTFPHYAARL